MPQVTIKEIFTTPWGLLASRRQEVESASYGQFAKIEKEELEKNFLSFSTIARLMDCSESTARRWINRGDPRFIVRDGCKAFLKEDAQRIMWQRRDELKRRAEARKARAA